MRNPVNILLIFSCLFFSGMSYSQESKEIPRDTTYTLWSATNKIKNSYPFIVPVKELNTDDIRIEKNLAYSNTGSRELELDIFRPETTIAGKLPCIVCIHGGGWASGSRSLLVPMAQKLAQNGYVGATVEYRLSPESKYPAGVIDVKKAIKWLKINASVFNIDTNQVAILGTSAGATIATLVGNTPGYPIFNSGFTGRFNSTDQVQAIINIDGILDFTDPAESGKDNDPEKPSAAARWFGQTYKENPELWRLASPLVYAGNSSPPTLFINSSVPRFHAGRDAYIAILDSAGIYCKVHTISDSPHSFWLFDPWFSTTVNYVLQFLDRIFEINSTEISHKSN